MNETQRTTIHRIAARGYAVRYASIRHTGAVVLVLNRRLRPGKMRLLVEPDGSYRRPIHNARHAE